jgi:hypothetical protein
LYFRIEEFKPQSHQERERDRIERKKFNLVVLYYSSISEVELFQSIHYIQRNRPGLAEQLKLKAPAKQV